MRKHLCKLLVAVLTVGLTSMKFILLSALVGLIATPAMGAEQWNVFETSFTSARK